MWDCLCLKVINQVITRVCVYYTTEERETELGTRNPALKRNKIKQTHFPPLTLLSLLSLSRSKLHTLQLLIPTG